MTEINKSLSILGVTIEDISIPNSWVYYEKTDSYYAYHLDTFGLMGMTVMDVVKNADGTTAVYWQTYESYPDTKIMMVVTLRERDDGSYLVLSNVPVK